MYKSQVKSLISFFWKISLHMISMGGMLGIILASHYFYTEMYLAIICLTLVSIVLAIARIKEKAHSSSQIIAGFILGLFVQVFLLFNYLNITLIWNKGIAFGLFSFNEVHLYNILSLIISIIVVILVIMSLKSHGFKRYSLLMIVGGALGNLHDRIFFNAVPDFIDFHVGNFHWFIFNVSDIFITLGVISMIVLELADNKTEKTK